MAEVADIAHLLRGGELVLTTGIALPDEEAALTTYVDDLAAVGAAGLVMELVRRWSDHVPEALVAAADRHRLPLITLARETQFVSVTEAVVALIVDAQLAELRAAEQVHETFTALTVAGAEPAEVLREVARISGLPVVLETLGHDVLAYDAAGQDPIELLTDWGQRSRSVAVSRRTAYDEEAGWLITAVGAQGADWGRLVLLSPAPPPHRHVVVAERAASALAVHRLVARDRESLERQTHRMLLAQLLGQALPPPDLATRAAALGVALERRQLVGVAIRPGSMHAARPRTGHAGGVAGPRGGHRVGRAAGERAGVGGRRGRHERARVVVVAGAGGGRRGPAAVGQRGAPLGGRCGGGGGRDDGVARCPMCGAVWARPRTSPVPRYAPPAPQLYHRLDDVRLRGLLHLLREDERVRAFADRELGPLLARDDSQGSRLVELLRCFCEQGGNKSAAAGAAHLSRTAYYQQLSRIAQVLGVSLEDPESMLSLYVALLVHELDEA